MVQLNIVRKTQQKMLVVNVMLKKIVVEILPPNHVKLQKTPVVIQRKLVSVLTMLLPIVVENV